MDKKDEKRPHFCPHAWTIWEKTMLGGAARFLSQEGALCALYPQLRVDLITAGLRHPSARHSGVGGTSK
jgi:hypothetical protein